MVGRPLAQLLFKLLDEFYRRGIQAIQNTEVDSYKVAIHHGPEQLLQNGLTFGLHYMWFGAHSRQQSGRNFKALLHPWMFEVAPQVNHGVGFICWLLAPTQKFVVVKFRVSARPCYMFCIFVAADLPFPGGWIHFWAAVHDERFTDHFL